MKKSLAHKIQTKPQHTKSTTSRKLKNPRWQRAIQILIHGEIERNRLDEAVGCTNSPELVRQLRKQGFECPCRLSAGIDRDGRKCMYGIYYFTESDHQLAKEWLIDGTLQS